MPTGPQGQKRPGDVIGCAIRVAQIATGESEGDGDVAKSPRGYNGAVARAKSLSPAERQKIAKVAAEARWSVS